MCSTVASAPRALSSGSAGVLPLCGLGALRDAPALDAWRRGGDAFKSNTAKRSPARNDAASVHGSGAQGRLQEEAAEEGVRVVRGPGGPTTHPAGALCAPGARLRMLSSAAAAVTLRWWSCWLVRTLFCRRCSARASCSAFCLIAAGTCAAAPCRARGTGSLGSSN